MPTFEASSATQCYRRAWRLNRLVTVAFRREHIGKAAMLSTLRAAYFWMWRAHMSTTAASRSRAASASMALVQRARALARTGRDLDG